MQFQVSERITEWLGSQFETSPHEINRLFYDKAAIIYLIVWPIMEQRIFGGFMKKDMIQGTAEKYSKYYEDLVMESNAAFFHSRYQSTQLYKNLRYSGIHKATSAPMYDSYPVVDDILRRPYESLSAYEKITLMIYVVYRYRNNIFHGNKGIASWSQFSEEIYKCVETMMSLCDCHKANYSDK